MIKEKVKQVRKSINIYEFYCDICGTKIGESKEYDDGYVEKLGAFEHSIYFSGWYKFNKCLCPNCQKEYHHKIINTLIELGFKKDGD